MSGWGVYPGELTVFVNPTLPPYNLWMHDQLGNTWAIACATRAGRQIWAGMAPFFVVNETKSDFYARGPASGGWGGLP